MRFVRFAALAMIAALVAACGGSAHTERTVYGDACEEIVGELTVAASSDNLLCDHEGDRALVAIEGPGWAEIATRYDLKSDGEETAGASIALDAGDKRAICRLDRWGRGGCAECPAPGLARSGVVRRVVANWVKRDLDRFAEAPPAIDVDAELERLAAICEG